MASSSQLQGAVRGREGRQRTQQLFVELEQLDERMRIAWRRMHDQRWADYIDNRLRQGTRSFLAERASLCEQFEAEQLAQRDKQQTQNAGKATRESAIDFHQFPWGTVEDAVQNYETAAAAELQAATSPEERAREEGKEGLVLPEGLKTIAAGRHQVSKMREDLAKLHAKRERLEVSPYCVSS